jgi:hypothetical protein
MGTKQLLIRDETTSQVANRTSPLVGRSNNPAPQRRAMAFAASNFKKSSEARNVHDKEHRHVVFLFPTTADVGRHFRSGKDLPLMEFKPTF